MDIRPLAAAEIELTRRVRARSFGRISDADWAEAVRTAQPSLAAGRYLGAFDGTRLIATARIHDMTQWWNGRAVPMGGIGGMAVAPEERGRGVARRMMAAVLARCAELGHPLSVLFPATSPLYRSLGWEHAGAQHFVELPAEALRTLGPAERISVRQAGPDDADDVVAVVRNAHAAARDSGPIDWGAEHWRILLGEDDYFCYLAEDGFLEYRWGDREETLQVERLVAGSERTLRGLWAIVGSGSSTARTVRACVSPQDPMLWLLREQAVQPVHREPWMLRVVDAPAAIAARGFPAAVSIETPLHIDDADLPANTGDWLLTVDKGQGRLEPAPADRGASRVDARGLAALYAGVPPGTLRRSGLLAGDAAAGDALAAAFAAAPFSLDFF
jgi:predicted acetyltransferase